MGCCCSADLSPEQKLAISDSKKLDKLLLNQNGEAKVIKLLLLGTGSSGKSTIFKQMQILYQEGFTDFEKSTFKHVVRRNVVECLQTLVEGAARFNFAYQLAGAKEAAGRVMELDPLAANFWSPDIISDGMLLWKDPAIASTYEYRNRLQLLDSCDFLMAHIGRIGSEGYSPSPEDILRARLRTSGIVERMFSIHDVAFKFLDVGGQRNERRKWIHCFDAVTAVIFLTAVSEYDQVLYEDEKVNRLHESLQVFESICNNRFFNNTAMILFLNKVDLFKEKITKVPLNICFPQYTGKAGNYDQAIKYIEDRFLAQNTTPRLVFTHPTCATDTKNVERVFDACRMVILKESLSKLGFN